MSKIFHAFSDCTNIQEGDIVVPSDEIASETGRWFNCLVCGKRHGVVKHVEPNSVPTPDPEELA